MKIKEQYLNMCKCAGLSEPLLAHMQHCWKLHVAAHMAIYKLYHGGAVDFVK